MIVGTAAADTRDVKATGDGSIVHRRNAATPQIILTALRGCPSFDTREIHPEKGNTPSRAIANISLDAAITATDVFYINIVVSRGPTKINPTMATTFITQCACCPNARA